MSAEFDFNEVRMDRGNNPNHNRRRRKRRKKHSVVGSFIKWILLILLAILLGAGACAAYLAYSGKKKLELKTADQHIDLSEAVNNLQMAIRKESESEHSSLEGESEDESEDYREEETSETEMEAEILDANAVRYNGKIYVYNDDCMNFLIGGIDSTGTIDDANVQGAGSGQIDVLLLASLNNKDKKVTLIAIDRDTMTTVEVYDENGNYLRNDKEQIALSFGYGDGEHKSAELAQKAVSNLFYGLPISGYFMVNINSISVITDLMGGVELTLPYDYTEQFGPGFEAGSTVTITSDIATQFIRTRKTVGDTTNASRMVAQKTFINAMANKAIAKTKSNVGFPIELYNTLDGYKITDIDLDEFSYLASQAIGYGLADDFLKNIEGDSVDGGEYTEYYVNEKSLFELILSTFYIEK